MSYSKETMNALKRWADKTGKKPEDLLALVTKSFETMKVTLPDLTDEEREIAARRQIYRQLKSSIVSPSIWFKGVMLGRGDKWDAVGRQRNKALAIIQENPEEAIRMGLVQIDTRTGGIAKDGMGDVIILDAEPTWSDGRTNPRHGKCYCRFNHGLLFCLDFDFTSSAVSLETVTKECLETDRVWSLCTRRWPYERITGYN